MGSLARACECGAGAVRRLPACGAARGGRSAGAGRGRGRSSRPLPPGGLPSLLASPPPPRSLLPLPSSLLPAPPSVPSPPPLSPPSGSGAAPPAGVPGGVPGAPAPLLERFPGCGARREGPVGWAGRGSVLLLVFPEGGRAFPTFARVEPPVPPRSRAGAQLPENPPGAAQDGAEGRGSRSLLTPPPGVQGGRAPPQLSGGPAGSARIGV